jgi:tRNA(Ile)-lysidine synthase
MRGLGLDPVEVVRVAVAGAGGPEAAARTARHAALADAAQRWGCAAVLLAHSRDDQAETVLLGLARGSGARSLAGMAPVSGLLRRPFLDLDRSVLRAACLASDLVPWDDPQNEDPAFTRVRVRRHVLPLLEREIGPGVAAALARTARLVRADADALDDIARAAAAAALRADGLDVAALVALPTAVRTRVLRGAALAAGSPASALTATHVEALDALVTAWHGQGPLDLPGGGRAARAYGRLTVDRADEE